MGGDPHQSGYQPQEDSVKKTSEYIVVGRWNSERNSWIEDGDIRHIVSQHRTEYAAWIGAQNAHKNLGGCDGSDSLATVLRRGARLGSQKAKEIEEKVRGEYADTYEHGGWLYVGCDYWKAHSIVPFGGALLAIPK
jgi:hypothetical protein